jgi:hypothetical protein
MSTWGQGTTRGARKARAEALERDGYQCQASAAGLHRRRIRHHHTRAGTGNRPRRPPCRLPELSRGGTVHGGEQCCLRHQVDGQAHSTQAGTPEKFMNKREAGNRQRWAVVSTPRSRRRPPCGENWRDRPQTRHQRAATHSATRHTNSDGGVNAGVVSLCRSRQRQRHGLARWAVVGRYLTALARVTGPERRDGRSTPGGASRPAPTGHPMGIASRVLYGLQGLRPHGNPFTATSWVCAGEE